jgi:heme-degrading monooxygenase HmoA
MATPSGVARTPNPPYYAVIFTSLRTEGDDADYAATAERMVTLAAQQPGFLGIESARESGLGITVSYWSTEAAILAWKANLEHREAQRRGRTEWYQRYQLRVVRVQREYGFERDAEQARRS